MRRATKTTWRCPTCGSDQIEGLAWVVLNTKRVTTWEEHDGYWCPTCEDHVKRICEVSKDGRCISHDRPFAKCRDHP